MIKKKIKLTFIKSCWRRRRKFLYQRSLPHHRIILFDNKTRRENPKKRNKMQKKKQQTTETPTINCTAHDLLSNHCWVIITRHFDNNSLARYNPCKLIHVGKWANGDWYNKNTSFFKAFSAGWQNLRIVHTFLIDHDYQNFLCSRARRCNLRKASAGRVQGSFQIWWTQWPLCFAYSVLKTLCVVIIIAKGDFSLGVASNGD